MVQALKLTEADRNLAVEVSSQAPVGLAPRVRNPCQIAENCDHYPASRGQGLPKLCPAVDKWWLLFSGQAREEAPPFLRAVSLKQLNYKYLC